MKHASYRADVDGLRAVAVLSVLAYHAFPNLLPGGFVGVDIFFVISGFLISGIILSGLETGTFTFSGFYARRIRRIFPALTLVLAVTLVVGWFVLFPTNFRELGLHVAAGAAFLSNLALWSEAGYFDTAAVLKPLLHLWSLGIEEQYYLVWPLFLMIFYRLGRGQVALAIVLTAVVSFAINVALVRIHPTAAFYSPITRFWELMIGSLVACIYRVRSETVGLQTAIAGLGVILLAAALIVIRGNFVFPGWWALLPTLGAACIIFAGPSNLVSRVLAQRGFVHIGLISYPLYLWHWPLLTFARIVQDDIPPPWVRVVLLAISVGLADLTWRLVERKIRFRTRWWTVPGLATSMMIVAAVGLFALTSRVAPASASVPHLDEVTKAISDWEYKGGTVAGDTKRAVLFFGDSHMQQYWPRVAKIMREHRAPIRTVIFDATGGCAPVPGIERAGYNCAKFVDQGFERALDSDVEIVVIAASWRGFLDRSDYYVADRSGPPLDLAAASSAWVMEGFEKELVRLRSHGKRVIIVLSSPRGDDLDPGRMLSNKGFLKWSVALSPPQPRKVLDEMRVVVDSPIIAIANRVGAELIDPADWLCLPDACPAIDEAGRPLYKDASHLRASTARERFAGFDPLVYLP